jgi:Fe2+ or Zn2+ uptake regulation protein
MLELLKSTDTHPSAQWLYERMKPVFPRLSFSTVYRNLGILEREGALQRLTCGSAFDRYDGNAAPHSHFSCRRCGSVYDVDFAPAETAAPGGAERSGHRVEGCSVTYYGVCENCQKADHQNH